MHTCPCCGYFEVEGATSIAHILILRLDPATAALLQPPAPARPEVDLAELLAPLIEPQQVVYLPPLELPDLRPQARFTAPSHPGERAPRSSSMHLRAAGERAPRPWAAALRSWSGR